MSTKTRLMATLAGTVVMFLLGWLLYGLVLADFYSSNSGMAMNVQRSEANMVWWALVLGNLFQAYFLVYIFGNWANIKDFAGGFKAGATIGLIIGFGYGFIMFATTNIMNLTATLVDPFVTAIMVGVTGGVVGMMLGKK